MLIWPFLGKNSYFCNWSLSILKPIYHLFTCELGNLGCLGKPEAAKKVINSHQNIIKVAKTPYFITYPGFSPGSICRFCLKVVQMCSFACPSTSRNQFGCLISAGLRPKKTALCHRPIYFTYTVAVVRLRSWPFLPLLAIQKAKTMGKVLSARISSRRGSLRYNRGSYDDNSVSSEAPYAPWQKRKNTTYS